jgi:hypothetical protein
MERFDMPTVFGPSLIPARSVWGRVDMVSISFTTTRAAARSLVPTGIEVSGDEPVVTVSRMTYDQTDYLAGGGYNEVTVGISAVGEFEGARITGNFMPVVWVDEVVPLVIGREFLGYAKVHGTIPEVHAGSGTAAFELRERESLLLSGMVSELMPVDPNRLDAMRRAAAEVTVFGWKYIPGFNAPDADYPTRIPLRFDWTAAQSGVGTLAFDAPSWEQAPVGSRIVAALAELPVLKYRHALVATGSGSIDRLAAGRLTPIVQEEAADAR